MENLQRYSFVITRAKHIKKGPVDKMLSSRLEYENDGSSKEYDVKTIWDSAVYVRKSEEHLPKLYYLVL